MSEPPNPEETKMPNRPERFRRLKKFLAFFGIVISPGKKHPVHLSKVFFFWVLGFFGLLFLGMGGMYSYSTQPGFCNSCHIMEPYYHAWRTSKHYGKAVCVDCHYPPARNFREHLWHKFQATAQVVKYITRTYSSKPFAEIPDASCLRSGCHSTRLLEGKIVTARGIKFDHRPHLTETRRERKLRCVSCHSQIVVGNHVEVTYSTCYLCHFRGKGEGTEQEPIGGCLGCHNLPDKSFQVGNMSYNHNDFVIKRDLACKNCHLGITQGEGKAEQGRCFTCHNQPEKLARFSDTAFIHENHVTKHHIACLHCHEEMVHGFGEKQTNLLPRVNAPQIPETLPIGAHSPTLNFDCAFCHKDKHAGQLEMYSGKVASLGLPSIPSPMFLANVDCIGCHYREETPAQEWEFKGHTIAASQEACIKCHGKSFDGIWQETTSALKETLAELEKKSVAARDALQKASLTPEEKKTVEEGLQKAARWHSFVSLARGEHNIYLASAALRSEDALLSELGKKLGASLPDLSSLPLMSGGYCATMCHAKLGVRVPPETVKAFGKNMPHEMHTTMMGCVSCHKIGGHKEVPLQEGIKESLCVGCHPWAAESQPETQPQTQPQTQPETRP